MYKRRVIRESVVGISEWNSFPRSWGNERGKKIWFSSAVWSRKLEGKKKGL